MALLATVKGTDWAAGRPRYRDSCIVMLCSVDLTDIPSPASHQSLGPMEGPLTVTLKVKGPI